MASSSKQTNFLFQPLPRQIEPEILDHLSPEDEGAKQSRNDLVLINKIMGHAKRLRKALSQVMQKQGPIQIAEIGAGDGSLAANLFKSLGPVHEGSTLHLIDHAKTLSHASRESLRQQGWRVNEHVLDIHAWLQDSPVRMDACFATLFLHHFDTPSLKRLIRPLARTTQLFICCEPRRNRLGLLGASGLRLLGCHPVTLHDAYISVKSGFRAKELSAIWETEAGTGWTLSEGPSGCFSHVFKATCS